MGCGSDAEVPEIELGTMAKLETVGTVPGLMAEFVPVPVPGLGIEPGVVLELEMKAETEQSNKNSGLHP